MKSGSGFRAIALVLLSVFTLSGCSDRAEIFGPPLSGDVPSISRITAIPPGYYDTADPTTGASLRLTVHAIIDDHTRFPYTSTATDTWNILELADQDPGDAGRILDVYRNASYAKAGGGNTFYNREHTWPNSYGYPNDGSTNYPYTDTHALFLCDDSYNSSRSNKLYRTCDAAWSSRRRCWRPIGWGRTCLCRA